MALVLRVGLGLVILMGGMSKLLQALNAFKREFAVVAGAVILVANGSGNAFSALRIGGAWNSLMRPGAPDGGDPGAAPSG